MIMTIKTPVLAIAALLAFAPAAFAQTAPSTSETPPASASETPPAGAGSASVSDGDIQKFAVAAVALNGVQADTSIAEADKPSKMVAAVQQSGLDPRKFNTIAQAAQSDPALQKKIQIAAANTQPSQARKPPR
jgi:hypothetical protein